ncbi:MAG: hypothetical protein HEQ21_05290 [Blastomonas sp.]|uniref:hypothetical protein n=1 Tax=Blastomonas sp. TaxID=1909299 RepID=UPI00258E5153|nr:hypothetical protein [Blastomonas sp.]MCO5792213.1 hypothetical protein [Blastomonas sp.]
MDSVSVAFELMRIELDAEVESLNSQGAKSFHESDYEAASELTTRGRELKAFLAKVAALEEEWRASFSGMVESVQDEEVIEATARRINAGSRSSKTALLVRFPDGKVIAEEKAAGTLVAVLRHVGLSRVSELGVKVNGENLVSRSPSKRYQETPISPYFVKTHSSTAQKKRNIEEVSDALGLGLRVEII